MSNSLRTKQLETVLARLESQLDHLEAEYIYLNRLLISVGFPGGIGTLKTIAEELLLAEEAE